MKMLHNHRSQMYEWLPYDNGFLKKVPKDEKAKLKWLTEWRSKHDKGVADSYKNELIKKYGKKSKSIKHAEAYEFSEYGSGEFRDLLAKGKLYNKFFPF